jgi:hypothetical protein
VSSRSSLNPFEKARTAALAVGSAALQHLYRVGCAEADRRPRSGHRFRNVYACNIHGSDSVAPFVAALARVPFLEHLVADDSLRMLHRAERLPPQQHSIRLGYSYQVRSDEALVFDNVSLLHFPRLQL